ncbi:phage late control D family protein [Pantoea dispersa]|uniref:phage late control D family protein n=1 Tax=Pantoea dispersa TaxID=59814 RepID=UPI0021C877F0|nr:type IV secretion protein Rhs [Pantoea dispersa]UXO70840.1 type IV secretion protein Rhs [Pantoea dispersa]
MDVHHPITASSARHVSGRCLLNGISVPFVSFSIESNAFRGAGTFELTLAISALPPAMQLLCWWAVQTTIRVELFISIVTPAGIDEKKHITGNIDIWHYEPARFEITAEGRDYTAKLIDAKTPGESFRNLTSSQIASTLAQRHGLKPIVTATTQRVGEYYQIDSTHLTGEQSEWDLITSLAAIENFSVYVEGENLHFEPKRARARDEYYVIRWQPSDEQAYSRCNVSGDLSFSRALTISKGVTVEVLSWNAKLKNRQFIATYPGPAHGARPGKAIAEKQVYRVIRNGLTPAAAHELARSLYRQIIQHEMTFSGSVPGDNLLMPDTPVRIEGTESPFDQVYYCDRIRRSLNWETGYRMHISGKNHSPALDIER